MSTIAAVRLAQLASQLSLNRPVYCQETADLLGHWQEQRLIEQIVSLAETILAQERDWWGNSKTLERENASN
jgi:hypothetical protein